MIHTLEPATGLIVPRGQIEPSGPSPIRDVLELAAIERPRWPELAASILGPTAYVSPAFADVLLEAVAGAATWVKLHTLAPGKEGKEGTWEAEKRVEFAAAAERQKKNKAAAEWVEVKTVATVAYFSLWAGSFVGETFWGYGEVTPRVEVAVGDTVRFNVGALVLEIPAE